MDISMDISMHISMDMSMESWLKHLLEAQDLLGALALAMVVLGRISHLRSAILAGRQCTMHCSANSATFCEKIKFLLQEATVANSTPPVAIMSILDVLESTCSSDAAHIMDRGHKHTSGVSEVCFYIKQVTRKATSGRASPNPLSAANAADTVAWQTTDMNCSNTATTDHVDVGIISSQDAAVTQAGCDDSIEQALEYIFQTPDRASNRHPLLSVFLKSPIEASADERDRRPYDLSEEPAIGCSAAEVDHLATMSSTVPLPQLLPIYGFLAVADAGSAVAVSWSLYELIAPALAGLAKANGGSVSLY
jgi:hypothetical protein